MYSSGEMPHKLGIIKAGKDGLGDAEGESCTWA